MRISFVQLKAPLWAFIKEKMQAADVKNKNELAIISGWSPQTLSRLNNSGWFVTYPVLRDVCTALKMSDEDTLKAFKLLRNAKFKHDLLKNKINLTF